MGLLKVEHVSLYRYHRSVRFGARGLMFRPRDSHDPHLLDASPLIGPRGLEAWLRVTVP